METGRNHLHPNVKLLWFAPVAGLFLFVLVIGLLAFQLSPDLSLFMMTHENFYYMLPASQLIVAAIFYSWLGVVYSNFTYELTENEIVIREGVITRKTTVIPYAMIQDISSERSPMERMLGLATLEIETAGSGHVASEASLPGIADKDALIHEMMARVKRAKIAANGERNTQSGQMQTVLGEILAELKTISRHFRVLGKPDSEGGMPETGLFGDYEKFRKKPAQ